MKKPSKKCVKVAQRGRASADPREPKTTQVANSDPGGGGASLLGASGSFLGCVLGLPSLPQRSRENLGHFPFIFFSHLKPYLTSLHFSSLFLLRLGSLLDSILAPSWAPFWLNFGPSRLLKPYLVQKRDFHETPLNATKKQLFSPDACSQSGPRSL